MIDQNNNAFCAGYADSVLSELNLLPVDGCEECEFFGEICIECRIYAAQEEGQQ